MPGLCCLDARIWIWRLVQTINIRWNHLHRPIVIFLKVDASTILWIEPRRHAHKLPLFFVQNTHGATGKLPSGRWTLKSGFSTCTSRTAAANVQSSQVISVSSSPRSDRTLCLDGAGPEVVRVASGNTISRFPDANRHPGRAVTLTWASFATPTRETWNPASPRPRHTHAGRVDDDEPVRDDRAGQPPAAQEERGAERQGPMRPQTAVNSRFFPCPHSQSSTLKHTSTF